MSAIVEKRVNINLLTLSEIKEKGLESLLVKPKKRSLFVKGHQLGGRPKGLKNYKQFSLSYWYDLIVKEYPKLRPIQRSRIALECWKTLVGKSQHLPTDPADSKLNADVAMDALKNLEGKESKTLAPTVEKVLEPVACPTPAPQNNDSPTVASHPH